MTDKNNEKMAAFVRDILDCGNMELAELFNDNFKVDIFETYTTGYDNTGVLPTRNAIINDAVFLFAEENDLEYGGGDASGMQGDINCHSNGFGDTQILVSENVSSDLISELEDLFNAEYWKDDNYLQIKDCPLSEMSYDKMADFVKQVLYCSDKDLEQLFDPNNNMELAELYRECEKLNGSIPSRDVLYEQAVYDFCSEHNLEFDEDIEIYANSESNTLITINNKDKVTPDLVEALETKLNMKLDVDIIERDTSKGNKSKTSRSHNTVERD